MTQQAMLDASNGNTKPPPSSTVSQAMQSKGLKDDSVTVAKQEKRAALCNLEAVHLGAVVFLMRNAQAVRVHPCSDCF